MENTLLQEHEHNFNQAVRWGTRILNQALIDSPEYDARELALYVCEVKYRHQAPSGMDRVQWDEYQRLVQRRVEHEALQHIIGKMSFVDMELRARRGVFVTRPETEWMAHTTVQELRGGNLPKLIVDLGTGSGAIALYLARNFPQSEIVGVDVSAEALELARENQRFTAIPNVNWVQADARISENLSQYRGRADAVISNPPYVPPGSITQAEALTDPDLALYGGGEDGLEIPRMFLGTARYLAAPAALIVMEHAEKQAEALVKYGLELGLVNPETQTDLSGSPRFLKARSSEEVNE